MKSLYVTVFALSLTAFLAFVGPAFAQTTVVVPNSLENAEGDSGAIPPFTCLGGFSSRRTQQVYLASQFPQAGLIDKISFRLENFDGSGATGFLPVIVPGVLIELSTTQAQPNTLSTTFANNIGPDVQTVFSGDLTLSAPGCNTQPCPFDVMVVLQNQFFYDPPNGNLLLDIRTPTCASIPIIDATFDSPGIVAFAFANNVNFQTSSILENGSGYVTQFRLTQLPQQFITLSPGSATNDILTEHTVTATVITNGAPDPGELVTFEVISGPNAGETSDPGSGECTPNDDCTTDANGEVSWTYMGSKFPGTDTIIASFEGTEMIIESNTAEKTWVVPPRPIPTLSEWGLIAMAGVLGVAVLVVLRRKKAAA